ncbi:uncharacterized protein [Engystomops pustulosus]|uniref:uncharacterized protein n=1 Tax=Engystomops pustulosus TaxID=76066 RepID=UPI003AFAD9AE
MADISALIGQLRAAAQQGDRESVWRQVEAALGPGHDGMAGAGQIGEVEAAGSGEPARGLRRSRRTRPPSRLSPEATPRTRRRVRSPSGDPGGRAPAAQSGSRRPRSSRNPSTPAGPAERGRRRSPQQTPRPSSPGLQGSHASRTTRPPPGDVPVGGGAFVGDTARGTPGASHRQEAEAGRSEVTVRQAPGNRLGTDLAAQRGASCSSCGSCGRRAGSIYNSGREDGTRERSLQRLESNMAAGGDTAPMQHGSGPYMAWIFGHSYVYWGAQRASMRPEGRQLGFNRDLLRVRWLGYRGMKWGQVLEEFQRCVVLDKVPEVAMFHIGGNDLGARPVRELIRDIKHDLLKMRVLYPSLVVGWSDVVRRRNWRHARSVGRLNRARVKLNRAVGGFVARNGGIVVRHHELEEGRGEYWLGDGVHLNAVGMDLWALGIQGGLERAWRLVGGAHV